VPLPVLAGTVTVVRDAAVDHDISTGQLIASIERDEAFTANLLRFANSAANVRPIRAQTVRQAVTLLGRRQLAQLALEAVTYRFLEQVPGGGASRGQLHVHSLAAAAHACAAAELADVPVEDVHLAALLHDVGKLVMPAAFGEPAVREIAAQAPGGTDRARLERERLGVDHAYAGALLARHSGVSETAVEAIQNHHGGRSGQECPSAEAACVLLGNAVVHLIAGHEPGEELVALALRRLDLPATALDEIAEATAPEVGAAPAGTLAARVGELERLATTDDLTGLANRRSWLQHATEQLHQGVPAAVLICDVDHFKTINDAHGHRTGDLVLAELARVLRRHGTAGRLGGDEFAIWVTDADDARNVAERVIRDCAALTLPGADLAVTFSIGIAVAPTHGTQTAMLLEAADGALYEAKRAGRARAHVAGPPT
jgi:diguanylate cyclase (GGDEF)-like protein/putative nucleotidyltransferase with HDIG domain